jgi:hypothetical protein
LSKKKDKLDLELRNYEYDILCLKRRELKISMRDHEEEKDTDIMKILNIEISEFEDSYGFAETSFDGDESRISIEPPKQKVLSDNESDQEVSQKSVEIEQTDEKQRYCTLTIFQIF